MKKTDLIIGIVGGAAAGLAATYLLNGENRKNIMSGLQNLGEKAISPITNMLGEEAENVLDTATQRRHQTSNSVGRKGRM